MNEKIIVDKVNKLYEQLRLTTNDFDYFLIQADIDHYESLLMNIGEEEK